jgi:hypothetical protein
MKLHPQATTNTAIVSFIIALLPLDPHGSL